MRMESDRRGMTEWRTARQPSNPPSRLGLTFLYTEKGNTKKSTPAIWIFQRWKGTVSKNSSLRCYGTSRNSYSTAPEHHYKLQLFTQLFMTSLVSMSYQNHLPQETMTTWMSYKLCLLRCCGSGSSFSSQCRSGSRELNQCGSLSGSVQTFKSQKFEFLHEKYT